MKQEMAASGSAGVASGFSSAPLRRSLFEPPKRYGSISSNFETERKHRSALFDLSAVLDWDKDHCIRTKIFMTLDHMYYSRLAWWIGAFMCVITTISCTVFVIGTAEPFRYEPATCRFPSCVPGPDTRCTRVVCFPEALPWISHVELATVVVFGIDYLLRVLTVHGVSQRLVYWDGHKCHDVRVVEEPSALYKTVDYLLHYNQVIDLLVILPFLVQLFVSKDDIDLDTLRLFRVSMVLRVLKLGRYSEGSGMLMRTLRNSGPALMLLTLVTLVLMLVLGTFVYYFESGDFKVTKDHPEGAFYRKSLDGQEELSPFSSIPICAYWVAVTATTVGYGDLSPTSAAGQAMAVLISYAGIVGIALPVAVVVKEFNLEYDRAKEEAEEELRYKVQHEHGGHAEGPEEEHAVRAMEMRLFVKEQLRMAAPAWHQLWEEFAVQHLDERLKQYEQQQQQNKDLASALT